MNNEQPVCVVCGDPMPPGEEMFKFHGYSGPCPKPPLAQPESMSAVLNDIALALNDWYAERQAAHQVKAKAWREMQDKQPPGNNRWTYAAEAIRRDDEEQLEPIRTLMRRADAVLKNV